MRKRKIKLGVLLCTMLLAICLLATGVSVFAAETADGDEEITYKSLVSTGAAGAGEIRWGESGAPDSWPGAVEEIVDATQPDGGDVILRTELNANNELVTGQAGFARESTSHDKAAYPMAGLTMKFYANNSPNYMLMFTQNSGWYAASTYHWSLWFQGGTVNLRYSVEGGDNFIGAGSNTITYYSDYDYFADPVTAGYQAAGDDTKTFVGTQNVLEIKTIGGNLWVVFNGKNLFNLTEKGIVEKVINNADPRGMFVCLYQTGSYASAMKITDIYNVKSAWEDGVPETYTTTDATAVENKATDAGTVQFRSKESANYDFDLTYNAAQYLADLTATFTYNGNALENDDTLSVVLTDNGEATDKIELEFAKKSGTTAQLTVKKDGTAVGTAQDVNLSYNGTVVNTVSIKETVPFVLSVNGESVPVDQAAFTAMKAAITEGKVKVGYEVKGSAVSTLTPVAYTSRAVETFESVDGLTIDGNVTIKGDGSYRMMYNSAATGYTAKYTANKLISDSFTVKYKFGKYGDNQEPMRIIVGNSEKALVFEFAPVDGREAEAALNLYTENGTTEKKIASEVVDFNWTYEYGVRSLGFVNDGGASYLVFVDGDVAMSVSGNDMTDLSGVVNSFEGKMADVSFAIGDEALTAFAFCDYDYYVGKANAGGWGEGAIPQMQFGYDANDNAVLVFDNKYSYMKGKEVLVDGFAMTFKTYAKSGSGSPTWAISSSTAWYSNNSAIMFQIRKRSDTTATFNVMYTNKIEGDFQHIATNAENKIIISYTVNVWNWNNGLENTIALNCTDGVWRWTANGQVLETVAEEGEEVIDYSDYLAEVFTTFESAEKTGVVQIYGGANTMWNISSIAEFVLNVDPTVTNPTLKASYKVGEEITVNLGEVFSDENGDTLTYVLADDTAYGAITNGVWKFTPDAEGLYTVKIEAYDGKGGEATLTLTINVEKEKTNDNNNNNDKKKGGCGSSAGVGGIASLAIVLIGFAAILLKRKVSVK